MKGWLFKIAVAVLSVFVGRFCFRCADTSTDNTAVPLPTAYPRLPLPEPDFPITLDSTPVPVNVNPAASTVFTPGNPAALTVTYPGLNATTYWTFIPYTGDPSEIIKHRRSRIMLNLNGARANFTPSVPIPELSYEGLLVTATTGTQTPVQLLVVTPEYVITATSFLGDPRAAVSYDSLRPLIDMLERDMRNAIFKTHFVQTDYEL